MKLGRLPLEVSPASVNWLTTRALPPTSRTARLLAEVGFTILVPAVVDRRPLDVNQMDIPEQARANGKIFEKALKGLIDIDIVGEVRGSHFMIGIEFVQDRQSKKSFDDSVEIGNKIAAAAQELGLIVRRRT